MSYGGGYGSRGGGDYNNGQSHGYVSFFIYFHSISLPFKVFHTWITWTFILITVAAYLVYPLNSTNNLIDMAAVIPTATADRTATAMAMADPMASLAAVAAVTRCPT